MNHISAYSALSICVSFLLVRIFTIKFHQRLVDIPNKRSSHVHPTPRGGGLGIIISFLFVIGIIAFIDPQIKLNISLNIWLGLLPLIVISFIDDWENLSASVRYSVQLLVSAIVVTMLGLFPVFLGYSDNSLLLKAVENFLTIIGMTALINFYNFMDGLDGLVAGIAAIQLSFLALWTGNFELWILVAAILGFLAWNWQPAKIFMGDSGSTFLGAAIAIALLSKDTSPADAWAALTITLPITVDTIYTLVRRIIKRENIFEAHRSHLFQRLHQSGWSHARVSMFYIMASILVSIVLLTLGSVGGWINLMGAGFSLIGVEIYLKQHLTVKYLS